MKVKLNKEFNQRILEAKAPCGFEEESIKVWNDFMTETGWKHEFTDSMWNSCFSLGAKDPETVILFSGHIDSCSFMVSGITESGYLHIVRQGGANRRTIPDNEFLVQSRNGEWINAFCALPALHIESDKEYDSIKKMEDLVLDIGCDTKEEVISRGIEVGCSVVYKNSGLNLEWGSKYLVSQNLDDKAALLCLYELAGRLKAKESDLIGKGISVCLAAACQEESGLRGAKVLAQRLDPDYSIDIDCTHAVIPELGGETNDLNDIKFEKGPVIEFGPSCYRPLSMELRKLAEDNKIPFQVQASAHAGGTNTAMFQEHSLDCKTCLLSYPMTSMHTKHEKVAWEDLENLTNLLELWIWQRLNG